MANHSISADENIPVLTSFKTLSKFEIESDDFKQGICLLVIIHTHMYIKI